ADTLARFLVDREFQQTAAKGVILVDEASLISTRDMLRLFDAAQRLDSRIVLVGDKKQHRAVRPGEPLKILQELAGVPAAEITDVMRQTGEYRKAAIALSEGRIEDALGVLDRLGWIKEFGDADRNKQLADAYLSAVAERKKNGDHKS